MKPRLTRIIPVLTSLAVLAALPAPALASKSKQVIFKETTGECTKGMTSGNATKSSATITVSKGKITVSIRMVGATPNTTYQLDIVQTPSGEGCVAVPGDASLTTNAKGAGKAKVSEPVEAGATGVFLMLLPEGGSEGVLATPTVPAM